MSTKIIKNIKSILLTSTQKLKQNKIKNPHLEAEILLSHVLKKPREYLFTYPEEKLTKSQITKFQSLILQRIKGKPIAYLTNKQEFYGLDFYVDENVLIPRPETEMLIKNAELRIKNDTKLTTIIDVGTGSGCIIISLVKKLNSKFKLLDSSFIAIDISKKALSLAKKNSKTQKVDKSIKFVHSNLLEKIIKNKKFFIHNSSFLILANLPYLTPNQVKNSPSVQYEPKLALIAGDDGLKYYKKLFTQIKQLKQITKANINIICEIDPSQVTKIKTLIKKTLPKAEIQIKKDLRKKNRFVVIKL